jgi:long-chain acyl-CoA synthetase
MSNNIPSEYLERGLLAALKSVVDSYPEKIALVDVAEELSYRQFWMRVTQIAQVLQSFGIKAGDRVVFWLPNSVNFVSLHFAILRLSALSVPLDPTSPMSSRISVAAISKPSLIIFQGTIVAGSDLDRYEMLSLEHVLETAVISRVEQLPLLDVDAASCLSSVMFTSGSTGVPKGVKLTHRNNLAAARNIIGYCQYTKNDFEVITLPLTHSFGLGQVYSMLLVGGGAFVISGMLKMKSIVNALEKYSATGFPTTPAGVDLILNRYFKAFQTKGRFLKNMVVNSAPLSPFQTEKLQQLFPSLQIYVYYGLTEASRSCKCNLTALGPAFYHSVGPAMQGVHLVLDEKTAEISISGETVSEGYWPEDDHGLGESGYPQISTGDTGYFDESGRLYISGRIKDQINVGGYKVSPLEVEAVLKKRLPLCKLAVFGYKAPDGNELVVCCLERLSGSDLSHDTVRRIAMDDLDFYKVPSVYLNVEVIPTIVNGKIDRPRLPDLYKIFLENNTEG